MEKQNNTTVPSDAKTQEDQLIELKKLTASLPDVETKETQKSQLTELKKLNASLPDLETHENQLEELKKLNVHLLRYDKIIVGIGIATLVISVLVAMK